MYTFREFSSIVLSFFQLSFVEANRSAISTFPERFRRDGRAAGQRPVAVRDGLGAGRLVWPTGADTRRKHARRNVARFVPCYHTVPRILRAYTCTRARSPRAPQQPPPVYLIHVTRLARVKERKKNVKKKIENRARARETREKKK